MEHAQLSKAARELQIAASALPSVVEDYIGQCIGAFEQDKLANDETPAQVAELMLRQISKRIEDVMWCFDTTLESVDMPSRYSLFFRSLNLTSEGWKQLLKALGEHIDESAPTAPK